MLRRQIYFLPSQFLTISLDDVSGYASPEFISSLPYSIIAQMPVSAGTCAVCAITAGPINVVERSSECYSVMIEARSPVLIFYFLPFLPFNRMLSLAAMLNPLPT